MRFTDFCNCKSRHEHLLERSNLEVTKKRFHALFTSDGAKAPSDISSDLALDGAKPASASPTTLLSSSDEGASAVCSWWGFSIE
jgi:hypothetical protein